MLTRMYYCTVAVIALAAFADCGVASAGEDSRETRRRERRAKQQQKAEAKPVIDKAALMDVIGLPKSDATKRIEGNGGSVVKVTWGLSDTIAPGHVMKAQLQQEPVDGTQASQVRLVISQNRIATVPVGAVQRIVHSPFDVELHDTIHRVPMLAIKHKGMHHPPVASGASDADLLEVRAKCIAERLSKAWHLLDQGWQLEVCDDRSYDMPDNLEEWQLKPPFAPDYASNEYATDPNKAPRIFPAIYVKHEDVGNPLRIMTIYDTDAELTGHPLGAQGKALDPLAVTEVATYFAELIKAHHLLFYTKSSDIRDYDNLQICKTREGKIFQEIYLRAAEIAKINGSSEIDSDNLKNALARMSMDQRDRLVLLADHAPIDWRTAMAQ